MNVGTAPGYVGASATTTSSGSTSVLQTRSMTCWPPVVTSTSSGSTTVSSAAMTSAMHALVAAMPSVGAYWSARAAPVAAIFDVSAASDSGGNVDVSGSPPAREITSGRSVIAMRSRIAQDFMTFVREANSAAYRSRSRVERRGGA